MAKMKLKEWADKHGLSYLTANRHFHAGMIPNAIQLDSGTILVEDDSPEQHMIGNTPNDAISVFLKKTVEFSKNNASVEDFAAYVISNFQLRLNSVVDGPRYSKQKPKSEDIQKHFQQFIPKGEKPKPNSFVLEPEAFSEISVTNTIVNREDLVKNFSEAVSYGSPVAPRNYLQDLVNTPVSAASAGTEAMSPESTITQSVDLNTTPQPINYTGSNNCTFSGSFNSNTGSLIDSLDGITTSYLQNNDAFGGIVSPSSNVFLTSVATMSENLIGSFQPTQKELEAKAPADLRLNQSRSKRGRKPSKR